MSVLIMCSNATCGELLDVPDEAVGKKVRCPGCGTVQVVAQAGSMPAPAQAAGAAEDKSVAPKPPGPTKSAEKPFLEDPAGESDVDLTQFAEWAPGDDAAGDPKKADARPARGKPADGDIIDLTVLRDLEQGDAPAGPPPPKPVPHDAPTGVMLSSAEAYRATMKRPLGRAFFPADARPVSEGSEAPVLVEESTTQTPQPAPEEAIAAPEPLDDLPAVLEPANQSAGEGVLESKAAVSAIFLMGVIGILGGAAAGFFISRSHPVAGIYIGGALGWVAGFMATCLFVLSAERADERVCCPDCGKFFPEGTEFCNSCGAELAEPAVNPIARGGLRAGGYGLGSKRAIMVAALLGLVGGGIVEEVHQAAGRGASSGAWPWVSAGLIALVLACFGGYLLEFLLSAVRRTLRMDGKPPSLPSPLSMRNLQAATGAVAVVCVYVVPLVTLPLLPPALLYLATSGLGKALNVKRVLAAALRRSGDFVVLWLVVFLWVGGVLLSLTMAIAAFIEMDRLPAMLDAANPAWANPIRSAMWVVLTAVKSALVAAIVCVFGLAVARCIGLFGRQGGLRPAKETKSWRHLTQSPIQDDGVEHVGESAVSRGRLNS